MTPATAPFNSADTRDWTPEPRAMLDPWMVLRWRKRTEQYLKTGEWVLKADGQLSGRIRLMEAA